MSDLVSVIVVTYNSSEFIEETLDSIRDQTWQRLELIVTDDCSVDNTVDLTRQWVGKYSSRFERTEIVTVPKNTGIAANSNRGLLYARGEWLKYCAGDDVLMPRCIEDNLNYIGSHSDVKALFSYCRMYLENTTEDCFQGLNPKIYPSHIITDTITANDQYKLLLVNNRIPFTPSFFINRETRIRSGEIDENYPISEDYQLFLSLTKNGVKLYFMDKETMKYRIHQKSTSRHQKTYVVHPVYYKAEVCMRELSYPFIPWDIRLSRWFTWFVNQLFRIELLNKKTKFNTGLHFVLTAVLNPFHHIIFIKSHWIKRYRNNIFYR